MTIEKKLLGTNPSGGDAANVADVFSTHLFAGNETTNIITNGIDLAGEGGLVWIKNRNGAQSHHLVDTERGVGKSLSTDNTTAEVSSSDLNTFYSDGFKLGYAYGAINGFYDFVSWTFRKAPKFFDVVTWVGSGSARSIAHNLGAAPAFIMVKRTSSSTGWAVYHKDNGSAKYMLMDAGAALTETTEYTAAGDHWNGTTPSDTTFSLGGHYEVNYLNNEYVAYLFADNTAEDADDQMIKCGSYTGNGSANGPVIDLGWEPQYLIVKSASHSDQWVVVDSMRGIVDGGADARLFPNLNNAEDPYDFTSVQAEGFKITTTASNYNTNGGTYIYMAIRAPMMKEPESATEVYAANTYAGDNANGRSFTGLGLTPDVNIITGRGGMPSCIGARLLGPGMFETDSTSVSYATLAGWMQYDMDGFTFPTKYTYSNSTGNNYVAHNFKRAKGFFDVVAYSGNSVAGHEISHSLGVAPEMIWAKCRSNGGSAYYWQVYHSAVGDTHTMRLNENQTPKPLSMFNNITPTSFRLDNWANTNESGETYIAYLFATIDGVSKVGSYTGNGTSQTLDCGFAAGARFVLIKRTDATGDWYIWDTARGIVAGNDPHLSLNTIASEVTTVDSIDPDNSGFIANQVAATDINVTSADYIFYAIA